MLVGINTVSPLPGHEENQADYLRRLLPALHAQRPDLRFVIFTGPTTHEIFDGWDRQLMAPREQWGRRQPFFLQRTIQREAARLGVGVLVTPFEVAFRKPKVPTVLLATDLQPWERAVAKGGWINEKRMARAAKRCQGAHVIVVPSKFIQDRLLELLGVGIDRVVVAPPGVDSTFAEDQPPMAQQPYILAVGDTHEVKNLPRLRAALRQMKGEMAHSLVVVGRSGNAEPENWGPRVMRIDQCPVAQLAGLYQHSDLFVCPSLYDGSGRRVLEAMRAGARIVASCVGAIPEVGKSIPLFFNPESVSSIVATLRRALKESASERETHLRVGQKVAAQYTWERCAQQVLLAIEKGCRHYG